MKPLNVNLCFTVLLLVSSVPALAEECKGLQTLQNQGGASAFSNAWDALWHNNEKVDCGSLTSVMDSVVNGKRTGGRKLEEDKPYDPAAAQANLTKAQADPEVRKTLDKIRKDVPDGPTRWAYEAATFDENGYYGARDLRVHQLQQQLK